MRIFRDRRGREWTVDITVGTVRRVKAKTGIDLPGLFGDGMRGLDALLSDDEKLAGVIYQCCAAEAGGTLPPAEDLYDAWDGATADVAAEVFLEELIDFFRDPQRRQTLRQAVGTLREMGEKLLAKGRQAMAATDLDKMAEMALTSLRSSSPSASTAASGPAPASLASTPAPSP